eukprot:CAMPEP_0119265294 /NCGR_PEP_ID=MMETSP1329-20130426/4142_1 /TAXON_ID=114041 /ORGANISM="Genus nov. species nov., Strain RCC1024" /LENGTH=193 /DNA_ID=CAMNT_0007265111 /DNA_START=113 /DNA_END=691 /DNA_ORIENTATION=-
MVPLFLVAALATQQKPSALRATEGGPPVPPVAPLDPSLFEEKAPPSWASPEWQWGSASGAAHEVAARVRKQFTKRHRRTSFLAWAKCGTVDMVDLKMTVALMCQKAVNAGADAPDGRWGSLVDAMARAEFMKEDDDAFIDGLKLAMAVNERLPEPFTYDQFMEATALEGELEEYPAAVVARALEQPELDFVAG